jgi:hypothetical protein
VHIAILVKAAIADLYNAIPAMDEHSQLAAQTQEGTESLKKVHRRP